MSKAKIVWLVVRVALVLALAAEKAQLLPQERQLSAQARGRNLEGRASTELWTLLA